MTLKMMSNRAVEPPALGVSRTEGPHFRRYNLACAATRRESGKKNLAGHSITKRATREDTKKVRIQLAQKRGNLQQWAASWAWQHAAAAGRPVRGDASRCRPTKRDGSTSDRLGQAESKPAGEARAPGRASQTHPGALR